MPGKGTVELDFGAFPGSSHATVAVTGQAGIVAGSLVEAWLRPVATADHTADEHLLETLQVFAADIVAGVGFTVHGVNTSQLSEPLEPGRGPTTTISGASAPSTIQSPKVGGQGTRIYGRWTVAWVWD